MNYIGVDIGGTKISVALVTDDGHVIARADGPTPKTSVAGDAILNRVGAMAIELMNGHDDVAGVGVGAGGQVDPLNGRIITATDVIPGWAGAEVASVLSSRLRLPVAVDNDVNALAVGEARFGAACGHNTVIFLALGTGVGGALLVNGHLHRGGHWSGAEFGHIILSMESDAPFDLGGSQGTLEAYVSGYGLVNTWRAISGSDDPCVTGKDIGEEASIDSGSTAAEAVRKTGRTLGFGIASLANALDPDIIVVGGGLSSLGDLLLNPARSVLAERGLPWVKHCPVAPAQQGSDASVIGAAALAMRSKV